LHYFSLLESPRFEDFDWTSWCEKPEDYFPWLGNGFTVGETSGEIDPSYVYRPYGLDGLGADLTYQILSASDKGFA